MSLIDDGTPEGFFHMRIVPYKHLMLERDISFYKRSADADAESYFEDSTEPAKGRIYSDPALLSPKGIVLRVQEHLAAQSDLLADFAEPLERLRQSLESHNSDDRKPGISDFVYTFF